MALIALDYDGTYTEDPELWRLFVSAAVHRGHEVMIVTMRYETEADEVKPLLKHGVSRIICTARQAKVQFCEGIGVKPDIWIDDSPWWLLNGA